MNGDDDADDGNGNDDSHDNGDDYYDEDAADNDDADEADDADDDDGDGDEDDDGDFLFYHPLSWQCSLWCRGPAQELELPAESLGLAHGAAPSMELPAEALGLGRMIHPHVVSDNFFRPEEQELVTRDGLLFAFPRHFHVTVFPFEDEVPRLVDLDQMNLDDTVTGGLFQLAGVGHPHPPGEDFPVRQVHREATVFDAIKYWQDVSPRIHVDVVSGDLLHLLARGRYSSLRRR